MSNKTTILPNLYLASQSPRRREILTDLGIPFTLLKSPYKEKPEDVADLTPHEQAAKFAGLKAFHAAKTLDEGVVIGADTIVVLASTVMGKPKDRAEARQMLESLSGKTHKVVTGIAIVDVGGLATITHAESTKVTFKDLSEREIRIYSDSAEPYDKAGAYAIQGLASLFVERIEGCYFNVVGFPVAAFSRLLKEIGLEILDYMKGKVK